MSQKNLKQKVVSGMRYFFCYIVGILLSLPVTAENAVLKKAELRVLDIYLATKDMYHCQNPEDYLSEFTSIVDGVVNDLSRAIIYDMQGRKLDNPQKF